MSTHRTGGFAWRHPAFLPTGAFLAGLLLAIAVGWSFAAPLPPPLPPPPTPPTASPTPMPTSSPTSTAAPFAAAANGIPQFEVKVAGPAFDKYQWIVLGLDAKKPGDLAPVGKPLQESPNVATTLTEPLVNRQICVTVPDGWSIDVSPSVPNLTQHPEQRNTACEGGWSDPRAVPDTLTFTAAKGS